MYKTACDIEREMAINGETYERARNKVINSQRQYATQVAYSQIDGLWFAKHSERSHSNATQQHVINAEKKHSNAIRKDANGATAVGESLSRLHGW